MTDKLYFPGLKPKAIALMEKARKTNESRDRIDRRGGGSAPPDCPLDLFLRTAISALVAGVNARDWDCVAEGLRMVAAAELRVRNAAAGVAPTPSRPDNADLSDNSKDGPT